MDDIFTSFYRDHIQDVNDFLDSDDDILYVNGFSGSGKSSVVKSVLKERKDSLLMFAHLCFKDTCINDVLLSFYDTFRYYSLRERITLEKNTETGFLQKVNFYFKNLEYPAVVMIDNYETISNDSEIMDFLLHIAGLQNVKLIVVSKNETSPLIENPTVSVRSIPFQKINQFEFQEIISNYFPSAKASSIIKFYNITDGYELYIKMVLTYLKSINMKIDDFVDEFDEEEDEFIDFIVDKQVSLIPEIYNPLLEILACLEHPVSSEFIETYMIGNVKQLDYLFSKFAVSEFWQTYYIKSYLKKYYYEKMSLQNKIANYNKLLAIYENELQKSPKDRLLRLSRESIRVLMSEFQDSIPSITKRNSQPVFNYNAQTLTKKTNWFVTDGSGRTTVAQPVNKKDDTFIPIEEKKPTEYEIELFKAVELEDDYRFKEAINILENAKIYAKTLKDKISVFSKIAYDALKMNDNKLALDNLRELCAVCLSEGDIDNYAKFRIETGKIYKKQYAFNRAKACFEEIIEKKDKISSKTLALARVSLAELYELENDIDFAIDEYKKALQIVLTSSDEKDVLLPEITYKLALINDENGNVEEALSQYRESVKYSETSGNDFYLTKAYTNEGVILADMGETDDALYCLESAYNLSSQTSNYTDTYYIARSIAQIYKNIEPNRAYDYLTAALDYAKLSDNSFEIAISLLELGDFYYDSMQNEQALICYFQAKQTLGESASNENIQRISTRINDMRIKLGDVVFNSMKELYDLN